MSYTHCPTCNKSLSGVFKSILLTPEQTAFYNKHLNQKNEAYCTVCADKYFPQIVNMLKAKKGELEERLKLIVQYVPILTTQAPVKWNYDVIDMITAQKTTGTGFITELSQSFNDFFGQTSNTTNLKIANATDFCKNDLRIQCIKRGGDVIIGTDIDFSEVGSGSTNMLMVCMAGTAIKVSDKSVLPENYRNHMEELSEIIQTLNEIHSVRMP